jgi:TatD DNase family protein
MVDTHIHLDADQYANADQLIKRALAAGVEALIVPGVGPDSNARVLALARRFPSTVHPALGFHPEREELTDGDLADTIVSLRTERRRICALGEVGLPYYAATARERVVKEAARLAFFRFAQIAVEEDLALIIHAPHETAAVALDVLRTVGVRRAVFHWHKGTAQVTEAILSAGYHVSLTPEVVYRERDQVLAAMVPIDQLLVETDGPWPYSGPFEGQPTEPPMIALAIDAIARVRKQSPESVREATVRNAKRLFRI